MTEADGALERAISFLTYAKEFSKAARIITDSVSVVNMPIIAVSYLYGHAIELALKSILVKNDIVPSDQLRRKIGHDLEKSFKKAKLCPESVFVDQDVQAIIDMLNPEYAKKQLEYHPGERGFRFPDPLRAQETVEKLIAQLDNKYRACSRQRKRKRSVAT